MDTLSVPQLLRWLRFDCGVGVAVDETVILLQPPLPVAGVSIVMERGRQQNDSLVNGQVGVAGRAGGEEVGAEVTEAQLRCMAGTLC